MASTPLTSTIMDDTTTLPVSSTAGFLSSDKVVIGSEKINYTGKTDTSFTGCTRGYLGTAAVPHAEGSIVYTTDSSALNSGLGFSVSTQVDNYGVLAFVTIPFNFFMHTVPKILTAMLNILSGSLWWLALFWVAMFVAFVVTLALYLISARPTR